MEAHKYVSPQYAERLDKLAETLVTARRFGGAALQNTVECSATQLVLEIPDNILIGQE